jgi:BMFP domain-containing protein YqiC
MRTDLARFQGRLDLLEQQSEQGDKAQDEQREELSELAVRVAELERRVFMAAGAATVLGAAIGLLLQFLGA